MHRMWRIPFRFATAPESGYDAAPTMLGWKTRQLDCTGSVLFRGSMAPLLENFTQLAPAGVRVWPRPGNAEARWLADLEHPAWGRAEAICLREFPPVPE